MAPVHRTDEPEPDDAPDLDLNGDIDDPDEEWNVERPRHVHPRPRTGEQRWQKRK